MADETKIESTEPLQKTRRSVVTTAAQVAVTAPAVGLLLSASTVPAAAQITQYQASQLHILDDYLSGNLNEDIDALRLQTNVAYYNGSNLDDTWPPPTP